MALGDRQSDYVLLETEDRDLVADSFRRQGDDRVGHYLGNAMVGSVTLSGFRAERKPG